MGCGLLVGGLALTNRLLRAASACKWKKIVLVLVSLLLVVPLLIASIKGNDTINIVRDVIPFLFLFAVPVLLIFPISVTNREVARDYLTLTLLLVGVITALIFFSELTRYGSLQQIVERMQNAFHTMQYHYQSNALTNAQLQVWAIMDLKNQANAGIQLVFLKLYDPAVLFAALFLSSWGVVLIIRSWRWLAAGTLLLVIGTLIAYGSMIIGLRTYTAFYVLVVLTVVALHLKERGLYTRLLPIAALGLGFLWPQIEKVLKLLWIKEQVVGANGKGAEWHAIISLIFSSAKTALFGIGWGGVFENPIYSDEPSRFSHSILSFFLLKGGIVGLTLLLAIVALLIFSNIKLSKMSKLTMSRYILLLSCIPPLVIGLLFEPTYKMISYGVIFSLFILALPLAERGIV